MIDGGSRAFGADDVAGVFYAGKRIRKLRFLMTDNSDGNDAFMSFGLFGLGTAHLSPTRTTNSKTTNLTLYKDFDNNPADKEEKNQMPKIVRFHKLGGRKF